MRPEEMAIDALRAINDGTGMTMVTIRGQKMPKGFPRGEFLCDHEDGRVVKRYKPERVLAWLKSVGLIDIVIEK